MLVIRSLDVRHRDVMRNAVVGVAAGMLDVEQRVRTMSWAKPAASHRYRSRPTGLFLIATADERVLGSLPLCWE
jgi:hypothetical protein